MDKFNSLEYKRSRKFYNIQCAVEYFVSLLVLDAFLAKLLTSIGISDSLNGIISSFISLAFGIQIFSLFIVKIKTSRKRIVMIFDVLSMIFFMCMFLVPFLPVSKNIKTVLVVIFILLGYGCYYLIFSIYYKWANSFVEPTERASFSANKEIISLFSGMIFTAVVGYIIDRFEGLGNLNGGFLFIAASILILTICNIICLSSIKRDDENERASDGEHVKTILKNLFSNKNYCNVIILNILWNIACYFSMGFMGVYKTNDLMMSVFLIQVINIVGNFARMIFSKPIGRYSDKTSYAKGFKLGLFIMVTAFFINIFTAKSTWFLIIPFTILYNVGMAGVGANSFNMIYSYVDEKYIAQAMALKNCISGIFGFAASLLSGKIMSVIQANNNTVFGFQIYAQQLFCAISFIICIFAILYVKKVIEKQKVIVQ